MAYDGTLAERVRELLPKATERKMFGGVGWMERGNLVAGIQGDDLIVRVPPAETAKVLAEDGVKPFMAGKGKGMSGWVLVDGGVLDEEALPQWVERSRTYVRTLPAK